VAIRPVWINVPSTITCECPAIVAASSADGRRAASTVVASSG
jgi:hypothetical protein